MAGGMIWYSDTQKEPTYMDTDMIKEKVRAYAEKAVFSFVAARKWLRAACARLTRREYTMRDGVILLFVAIVLGAALKTVASGMLTIGYQDYQLKPSETIIDIGALQKEMIEKGGSMSVDGEPSRASCSE
jgi:hypothetical protein